MNEQKNLEELKEISITWNRHKTHNRFFQSEISGEVLLLRLNDFPDEPLLTLIRGIEVLDIDDTPEKWSVPF